MEAACSEPGSILQFPPGFRFYPSDEELIVHYLQNKVTARPLPATIIAEVDLYKYNPWELPEKALFGEDHEWYFFSPREKKYPNGSRPNRAAGVGYWKATAIDKPIFSCSAGSSKRVGVKKALVFYAGRAPRGLKTDWMMSEYRLIDTTTRLKESMRLDDWVLCRVRLKSNSTLRRSACQVHDHDTHDTEMVENVQEIEEEARSIYKNNNQDMTTDCLYNDYQLLATILADEALPISPIETISSVSSSSQGGKKGNNNFTRVSEDGSEKVNNSPALKRKLPSEENLYENENFPLGQTFPNHDMNYYSQLQDVYTNLSDPIFDFQELNDQLAFTGNN
ncbi:hypothetical protein ACOSP7_016448 [Xanthoceras sorbifolium]|uniref:NAC domain-containing protein n=1 Tax=Xanthoceras sorbifolium TaxID=99658 RepID=A0ABQ8GZS7_9ROSI|nr:hypothetical protein JRO89_XSUnG0057600 [Xanthoceras sorbifolium]